MSPVKSGSPEGETLRLPGSREKRMLLFFGACLAASLLVTGASLLDRGLGFPAVSAAVRLGIAAFAYGLSKRCGFPAAEGRPAAFYLFLCLIPLIYTVLAYLGPFSGSADVPALISAVVSALSAALWEEAVFRHWGRPLFEENGQYRSGDFLFTALVFGAMHLVNLISQPADAVFLQAMFAVVTALFLQAVYAGSGSLRLIIGFHFLTDLAVVLLTEIWVTDPAARCIPLLSAAAPIVLGLYYALCAAVIVRRKELIKPSKLSSFLHGKKDGKASRPGQKPAERRRATRGGR